MLDQFATLPPFSTFTGEIKANRSIIFEELWDTPKALYLLYLMRATSRSIIVITSGEKEQRLLNDIEYFSPGTALEFPSWEMLPGDEVNPSPDIVGKRLSILGELAKRKTPSILLTPLQGLLQKLPAKDSLLPMQKVWKVGDTISFETLPEILEELGYHKVGIVSDKGQYALRGGILDLFPLHTYDPYRIEFFGDTIEQIKSFDCIGQTSLKKVPQITITPADEMKILRTQTKHALLTQYFSEPVSIAFDDLLSIEDKYTALKSLPGAKSPLFYPFEEFLKTLPQHQTLYFTKHSVESLSTSVKKTDGEVTFDIFGTELTAKRLSPSFQKISEYTSMITGDNEIHQEVILQGLAEGLSENADLTFITATEAEEKKLHETLLSHRLPCKPHFKRGYLSSGFVYSPTETVIIPYPELSGRVRLNRPKWRNTYHTPSSEFHELEPGDLVVHFHNGIGKFIGLEKQKNHLGEETEFLILEYAGKSKLFVPLSQSHLISRYIGAAEGTAPLHSLGTKNWQRIKTKAQQSIIGYAKDLLHIEAQRLAKGGNQYPPDGEDMQLFEMEFPFEETADQINSIAQIKEDMQSVKAMDRLICGDVGYGKTEVAMRTAFKAVMDGGKQVAVLVPTTILAMQHYETFCDRMANFPVNIGVLSRFRSAKEVKETIEGTKNGSVDIIIGTHRLISKDVQFKNLGLIIIDEEQRFGVRAKEHLKKLKIGVDCITLSATPIPRTLYMSMTGARDMSVINTPPHDRLPIKTIICERDANLIKNALIRELARDGQAYFIHNRVESITRIAKELEELLPDARLGIVHGQMPPGDIDKAFHLFKRGDTQILIATSIVENGVDIPNANTILIDRSHHHGLADLYQMRGRVGRWNRPSYAYFLTPKNRELPEISIKRLNALVEASGHGGGMKLAIRDLEIRGAGDILGVQQSGQVAAVGFHLYCKMLKRAVEALKDKRTLTFLETKVEFPFKAFLPENYINETSLRLEIYHRLGEAMSNKAVDTIFEELRDRFGPYPDEVIWLKALTRIRLFANEQQIILLKLQKHTLYMEKQVGKEVKKSTQIFPRVSTPEEVEEFVVLAIKNSF